MPSTEAPRTEDRRRGAAGLDAPITPRRRSRRALRALSVVGVGAFLALLAYGLAAKAPETSIDDALGRSEARPAPGFVLPVLAGGSPPRALSARLAPALADGRVDLRELRGVPVVLNFWASWCDPCREEGPLLERTWREAGAGGVAFVGLNMQDFTEDARGFLREFGVSYPNVRDRSNEVALRWGVTGLPETFFISLEGEVVGHVIGVVSPRQLEEGMQAARSGRALGPLGGGDRRSTR